MGSLKKAMGYYPTGGEHLPIKVDADGKVVISAIPYTTHKARAYLSADQLNITKNVATKILLNTESYDIGSDFDTVNSKFVVPVNGYYLICGCVYWTNLTAGTGYPHEADIYKNGAVICRGRVQSSSTFDISSNVSDIVYLEIADEIELYAYHYEDVSTVDILSGVDATFMSIHLLST